MLEKGDGQEYCMARVTEPDYNADYRGASLLHFAVLNEQPEMLTLLCDHMKEYVCGCARVWVCGCRVCGWVSPMALSMEWRLLTVTARWRRVGL